MKPEWLAPDIIADRDPLVVITPRLCLLRDMEPVRAAVLHIPFDVTFVS